MGGLPPLRSCSVRDRGLSGGTGNTGGRRRAEQARAVHRTFALAVVATTDFHALVRLANHRERAERGIHVVHEARGIAVEVVFARERADAVRPTGPANVTLRAHALEIVRAAVLRLA